MLSAIGAALLVCALVVNILHRSGYRVMICLIVILSTAVHTHFFYNDVSFSYYGTAAIANLCVILFLSLASKSPLATSIQIINLAGIIVSMVGYVMYETYQEAHAYNAMAFSLIIIEFLRLIVRTSNDRIHDVCEDDRLHHGLSVDGNISNSTNTSRCK